MTISRDQFAADSFSDDARLLRAIADTSGSVILALRPDHTIFAWNRAAEALYQTPREEAIGLNYVQTFIAPEHQAAVETDIRAVLAGKQTLNFEDDSILPDGRRRTLIWNVTRILSAEGAPEGILAIGQDITERKSAEERFRLVFEHAQDGLLISDDTGVVIDCNPASLKILGFTDSAELVGRRPAEFSPELQPDGSASSVRSKELGNMTRERGELVFEWTHQRADGSPVPLEISVRHTYIGEQRVSVVRWHDLSKRVELERQREEVQRRLQQAQKLEAVSQLAGGVAHDFNNLLAAIRNAVELAAAQLDDDHAVHADLSLALDGATRAAGLTKQLLAFSRQRPAALEVVDLGELVRDAMGLLRSLMPSGVDVVAEVADELMLVDGDRSQLDQVLLNLVLNARDASRDGGTLIIRVEPSADGSLALLSVRDRGTGMDPATAARVFEPFFTTKPVGEGTGLGLAVVYGIVIQAGGTIAIESAVDEGTTVRVALPISRRAPHTPSDESFVPARATTLILLVDDDAVVRSTTRRLLERRGWHVLEADSGEVAWRLFEADPTRIGIVLTDVRMPKLDGVQLARRIRATSPTTPIVLMSGFDQVDDVVHEEPLNVPLLLKPFTGVELDAVLSRVER